jgi:hypothetical protein
MSWPGAGDKKRAVLRLTRAAPDLTCITTQLAAQRRLASSVGGESQQQVGSREYLQCTSEIGVKAFNLVRHRRRPLW